MFRNVVGDWKTLVRLLGPNNNQFVCSTACNGVAARQHREHGSFTCGKCAALAPLLVPSNNPALGIAPLFNLDALCAAAANTMSPNNAFAQVAKYSMDRIRNPSASSVV